MIGVVLDGAGFDMGVEGVGDLVPAALLIAAAAAAGLGAAGALVASAAC